MSTSQSPQASGNGPNIVALVSTVFGSFVASFLVIDILYQITNHVELWIVFFIQISILIMMTIAVYSYLYAERYRNDLWWQVRLNFLLFIQMLFLLTVIRLIVDILIYMIDVSQMRLTDYINLFSFTSFVVFVLIAKIQVFLS